jgi:predicted ATPase
VPLIATQGYAAPGVGSVYLRARELYQQLGDTPDVSEVLWGLWTFRTLRAELVTAREIAEELLRLADRLPYPGLGMRGHWAMEITFTHLGEFRLAMEHYEKALSLYDRERHLDDAFFYALNPGVAMPCFAALSLWFLGLPDQAVARIEEALTFAHELSEPHSLAHALLFAAILYQLRREEQMAKERAEATIAVSSEHGLVMYQAMATIIRGWTLMKQGRPEEAIQQMQHGLAALETTGTELVRPHFLALLAEALDKARQGKEGLRVLDEALELANRKGERYYEAELYRLKGELLLMQPTGRAVSRAATGGNAVVETEPPAITNAERCFNQSIRIARQQSAKSLELRAVMSMARLHQKQGKQGEARDLLAQSYDRFTEGFDTLDQREAKALLDALS